MKIIALSFIIFVIGIEALLAVAIVFTNLDRPMRLFESFHNVSIGGLPFLCVLLLSLWIFLKSRRSEFVLIVSIGLALFFQGLSMAYHAFPYTAEIFGIVHITIVFWIGFFILFLMRPNLRREVKS